MFLGHFKLAKMPLQPAFWISLVALCFFNNTFGLAAKYMKEESLRTAEYFDALKAAVKGGISLKKIEGIVPRNTGEPITQQRAQEILQKLRDGVMTILKPYLKEVKIPRSSTDSTLVSYQLMDFKELEGITPQKLIAIADSPIMHDMTIEMREFPALVKQYPDFLKDTLGDIAAQFVLFDEAARAKISQLFIDWFKIIQQEVSQLVALFDPKTIASNAEAPEAIVKQVEKISAKSRQYQRIVAPLFALWQIIVQGLLGENSYTMLLDYMPTIDRTKTLYVGALKSFDAIKETLEAFLKEVPMLKADELQKFISSDLILWAVVGALFLPESLQKTFIDEPLRKREEDRKKWEAERKKYEEAEAKGKKQFEKIMADNPDVIKEDWIYVWDYATNSIDEAELKRLVDKRKAWLAQHPEGNMDDFMLFGWRNFDENKLQEHLKGKANWIKEHPGTDVANYHSQFLSRG